MADTGQVVHVTVTPVWESYRDLCLAATPRRLKAMPYLLLLVSLVGMVVLIAPAVGGESRFPTLPVAVMASLPLCAVWMVFAVRRGLRRRWEASPGIREPRAYEFSDAGIHYEGETSRGSMAWSRIRRVKVLAGNVVMFADPPQAHYVPESELTPDRRAELEGLLRAHVPGFSQLPPRPSSEPGT